jgi:hypothetical protein
MDETSVKLIQSRVSAFIKLILDQMVLLTWCLIGFKFRFNACDIQTTSPFSSYISTWQGTLKKVLWTNSLLIIRIPSIPLYHKWWFILAQWEKKIAPTSAGKVKKFAISKPSPTFAFQFPIQLRSKGLSVSNKYFKPLMILNQSSLPSNKS